MLRGAAAHAAFPEKGISAISVYAAFLCRCFPDKTDALTRFIAQYVGLDFYGEKLGVAYESPHMGRLTISFGTLENRDGQTVLRGDVRYPVEAFSEEASAHGVSPDENSPHENFAHGSSSDEIIQRLTHLLKPLSIRLDVPVVSYGYHLKEHAAFDILKQVCKEKGEAQPRLLSLAGGTYARKFGGRMVAFGGCGENVHAANERVSIDDFIRHVDRITYTLYRLSKEL